MSAELKQYLGNTIMVYVDLTIHYPLFEDLELQLGRILGHAICCYDSAITFDEIQKINSPSLNLILKISHITKHNYFFVIDHGSHLKKVFTLLPKNGYIKFI